MLRTAGVQGALTPYPQGSGRTFDWRWPKSLGNADAAALMRGGAQTAQNVAGGTSGTAAIGIAAVGGSACTVITTGTGGAWWTFNDRLSWMTERPGGAVADWNNCMEFRAVMRFDVPTAAVLGDTGVMIICGSGVGAMDSDGATTAPGVKFGPAGPGVIRIRSRVVSGAPGYVVDDAVSAANTPDLTKWNMYALRLVTGDPAADPYLVGLINGIEVTARYPWTAAAAKLPGPAAYSAVNVGYQPQFGVRPGGAGIIPTAGVRYLRILAAESLQGLL